MIRSKSVLLLATASLITLTACTDINTSTSDPNQRTKEGVGVGALTGAVAGLVIGNTAKDRRNNAILGAVVGGAAGGLIGKNLDKQAAELESALGNGRIQIINTGEVLIVRMPEDILFPFDSASLKSSLRSDLGILADNLQRYPGSTVEVTGHTDNVGTRSYNRDLSSRRANAVANVLISNGVSSARLRTVGVGADQPIASNDTTSGRAQNRRVEIVIRPNN